MNILPQLRLASYSVGVSITETTEISQIGVRRLSFKQGASEDGEETVEGADIMMSPTDPGKVTIITIIITHYYYYHYNVTVSLQVTITYNPDVRRLQTELRTEKHPLQLIVEYEVSYHDYIAFLLQQAQVVKMCVRVCVCMSLY